MEPKTYTVIGEFRIEAICQDDAENIVQNAVQSCRECVETIDVNAESDDEGD